MEAVRGLYGYDVFLGAKDLHEQGVLHRPYQVPVVAFELTDYDVAHSG